MIRNLKIKIVHRILDKNRNSLNEISFDNLTKIYKIELEELEEVLFNEESSKLFKLNINYEKKIIKINFIRKLTYSQENINQLKSKVLTLKQKMRNFINKIEILN